jgi:predicted pyridoxine 5'-phosphate oxidase superfamily flavin-nucleotide-binding protein
MAILPESVSKAWDQIEGPIVFTTVNKEGTPNSIYATCISKFNEEYVVVADNYFSKTKENIKSGSKGSLLFFTKDKKSYQIKGTIEYHTEGAFFDDMKKWNPEKHPGHAAAAIKVEEVYSGSEKLL